MPKETFLSVDWHSGRFSRLASKLSSQFSVSLRSQVKAQAQPQGMNLVTWVRSPADSVQVPDRVPSSPSSVIADLGAGIVWGLD